MVSDLRKLSQNIQHSDMPILLKMNTDELKGYNLSVGIVCHKSPLNLLELTLDSLGVALAMLCMSCQVREIGIYILDNSSDEVYSNDLKNLVRLHKLSSLCQVQFLYAENKGFGAAHNAILMHLKSDFHLVLNPDVMFDEAALVAGMAAMERHGVGLVLPRIFDESLTELKLHFWFVGPFYIVLRSMAPKWLKGVAGNYLARKQIPANGVPIEMGAKAVFSGCCMLFDRRVLSNVGGFDSDYFMYFEDYDLSLRILQKRRVVIEPAFSIVHLGGNVSRKNWFHRLAFMRSAVKFYSRVASSRIFAPRVGK